MSRPGSRCATQSHQYRDDQRAERPHELKLHVKAALNNGVSARRFEKSCCRWRFTAGCRRESTACASHARHCRAGSGKAGVSAHGNRAHSAGKTGARLLPHLEHGDLEAIRATLHPDATWRPMSRECRGPAFMGRATRLSTSFWHRARLVRRGRSEDHGRSHGVDGRHRDVRVARHGTLRDGRAYDNRYAWSIDVRDGRIFPSANTWTATTSPLCSAASDAAHVRPHQVCRGR